MRNRVIQFATTVCLLASAFAISRAEETLHPDVGEPLRDAAVSRGPDGTFYLTGTRASKDKDGRLDFVSNDGVKVWSSKDLLTWKDEGLVFNLTARSQWRDYLSQFYSMPDRPLGTHSIRGIVGPRLTVVGGEFLITISSCGHDVRWLRSTNLRGPYGVSGETKSKDDALIMSRGPGYGCILAGADGRESRLVWGPGYSARLGEDRKALVPESQTFLLARVKGYPNADWCARQFDPHAAALFLKEGRYILTWAAFTDEAGLKRDDSFYAVADNPEGPFSEPGLLIPGSGPVVLFDAGERGLMASCSMEDRPALAPLRWESGKLSCGAGLSAKSVPPALPPAPEMFDYARSQPSGRRAVKVEATGRSRLAPLFDLPLAGASMCRGGDGFYYLTGTVASKGKGGKPDFENNDGVYLWKSADLDTWTPLGKVWDIASDGAKFPVSKWQLDYRIPGDNPARADFCRGITAPEIHFAKGTYWIPYSMNGRGTGLLKSSSGKAEGPYEDVGRITAMGESASLFVDSDGKACWLWGKGLQMATLSGDNSSLASPVSDWFLTMTQPQGLDQSANLDLWDLTGPHLFMAQDPKTKKAQYCLSFSAVTQTFERANRDSVIVMADRLEGPYAGPIRMIPDGGQTSVVTDGKGAMFASFCGADPSAVFRDRPGIVPLEWFKELQRNWPRRVYGDYHTERGPWAEVVTPRGAEEVGSLRDSHVFHAPDGYFYYSASPSRFFTKDLRYLRAKDLWGPWEDCGYLYTMEQMRDDPNWPPITGDKDKNWNNNKGAWEPSMSFAKGTYWISCWFGGHGWGKDVVWKRSMGVLLRSTSGQATGPYVYHSEWPHDWQGLFVDDDGTVYGMAGACALWKMSEDLKTMDASWTDAAGKPIRGIGGKPVLSLKSDNGRLMSEDCGYQLLKIEGRYVFIGCSSHSDYDGRTFWASDIRGPYRYMGNIPRLGNCNIVRNKDGKWYAAFIQGQQTLFQHPLGGQVVCYEVKPDFSGPEPIIWPVHDLDHLTEAIYQ